MAFSDSFFNRIEKKTNVGKDTILELAKKKKRIWMFLMGYSYTITVTSPPDWTNNV